MSPLVIPYPNLDPVALQIGVFAVKWYGLAYLTGLVLGWLYIRRLVQQPQLWAGGKAAFPIERVDDLLLYMTFGVVAGGRLGSVLFYEPGYYIQHPLDAVMIWKGGMAFHGALLGCGLAIWLFARRYGPWAMVFPDAARMREYAAVEPTPRHPSQLYEAFFEGLVLFLVLRFMTHKRCGLQSPGLVTGMFLMGYGLARSFCELFRQPDPLHAFTVGPLTPGSTYSIPMILLGLWFISNARKQPSMA